MLCATEIIYNQLHQSFILNIILAFPTLFHISMKQNWEGKKENKVKKKRNYYINVLFSLLFNNIIFLKYLFF